MSTVTVVAGVYGPSLPPVEPGQLAAVAIDANRSVQAVSVNSSGVEVGTVDDPIEITQAALTEGIDQIAGLKKLAASGTATASGETSILSPTTGRYLRIYAVRLVHLDDTPVTVEVKQNAAGSVLLTSRLIDDGHPDVHRPNYWEFGVDDDLVLDLSGASDVAWSVDYTDRDPSAYPQES